MKDGFIKVAACTPEIQVADVDFNVDKIISQLEKCSEEGVKVAVFPELCITGYTCQDLFFQNALLDKAMEGVVKIAKTTADSDMLVAVGVPVRANGKLYNCAAVIQDGEVRAFVPKTHLPNYNEFYEARHFAPYRGECAAIDLREYGQLEFIPPMEQTVFVCEEIPELVVGFELCEDLWVADPVSNYLAKAGATLICNLSASDEVIGKDSYRRQLVSNQSARLVAGYIYCSAGDGESTQDMVFSGHNIIAENGSILAESRLFENGITISEIDFKKLAFERRKISTYPASAEWDYSSKDSGFLDKDNISRERFSLEMGETALTRKFAKTPFIPSNQAERNERCHLILQMQSHGLMKRIAHTHSKTVVIGISGGLDSTLALLVCVMAMDLLKRPHTDIVAVTMPCFGTTKRTRSNAEILCEALGVTFREVDISKAVLQHFEDIGHDYNDHSVVFENGQARERTKVLMNIANQVSGMVVGTGDLSELALGWATYNGDHMSMYGVNASIPKTLVRHIVQYYGDTCTSDTLRDVLYDILDTPVSPELLPTDESGTEMTQKTEDLVGPYELHDFFLYYGIRWGFEPSKVKRLAKYAFEGDYPDEVIDKWLKTFYRRFFSQQFKRSCLPDGAKIGSVTLSPRGDWRMPSDAVAKLWLEDIDK
ncbi:NAD(+) synthase [Ruminococcus bicirculans (ex Wegman et al. 2014)]|uniref:NAD(+) synthase n=1 Tax=Ruminococcus bicirculans (ex Wegman et al. 2014) TaxID=1160721 RepID=UPI000962DDD1|nr:NAD(+) synthase [Ruminococcus bicirculans (ex Wegman et al. 2014)]OLA48484.1 MAG: NAD(+) synthase [Ruminococcus bicirculans (ex Wegman et al. 2014)]